MENPADIGRGVRLFELDGQRSQNVKVPIGDCQKAHKGPRRIELAKNIWLWRIANSIGCPSTGNGVGCSSARCCTICTKPTQITGWSATRLPRTPLSVSRRSEWHWRRFQSSSSAASSSENSRPKLPLEDCDTCSAAAGSRARWLWLQGLFLPFSGYRNGPSRLAV
jgi:hypothetical protein